MSKPQLKDILFMVIVLLLVFVCFIFIIKKSDESIVIQPNVSVTTSNNDIPSNDSNDEPEADIKYDETIKVLLSDDKVYISENGKAFHINISCAGKAENIESVSVYDALHLGKQKCKRCLNNYDIK